MTSVPADSPSMRPGPAVGSPDMKNGFGLTAMCCGIVGVVVGVVPFFLLPISIPLGVCAVIFGSLGLRRVQRGEASNRPVALTGLITGIVACALSIIWAFLLLVGLGTMESDYDAYAHSPTPHAQHLIYNQQRHVLHQGLFIGNW